MTQQWSSRVERLGITAGRHHNNPRLQQVSYTVIPQTLHVWHRTAAPLTPFQPSQWGGSPKAVPSVVSGY